MKILIALLLLIVHASAADIPVEWDAPEPNVPEYRVYEKIGGIYTRIGTTTATKFTIQNVTPGTHTYVMTASNGTDESPHSNELTVTILAPPKAPLNFRRQQPVQQQQPAPK